jgi:hypothetical protein
MLALSVLWTMPLASPGQTTETNTNDANYAAIVVRNPFGLTHQTVQESPRSATEFTGWSNYNLTGVSADGRRKRAYFTVTLPGQPPQCRTVVEGQTLDAASVLKIDVAAETVTLSAAGVMEEFSFPTHGIKAAAPGPAPPTGIPARPDRPAKAPRAGGTPEWKKSARRGTAG